METRELIEVPVSELDQLFSSITYEQALSHPEMVPGPTGTKS